MDLIHLDFVIGLGPGVERAADAAPAELRVGAGESAAGAAAATAATAARNVPAPRSAYPNGDCFSTAPSTTEAGWFTSFGF